MAFVRCLTSGCLCERLKPFNQCQISILQIGVQASRRSSKEPTVASGEDAAVSKPGILNTEDGVPSTGHYHPKEPNNMSAYSQLCVSLIAFQCLCIISLHPTPSPPPAPAAFLSIHVFQGKIWFREGIRMAPFISVVCCSSCRRKESDHNLVTEQQKH